MRRHDYLVNLLQTVIETVFFYHPAVWWVSRQVRQSREECCDDIAVAACGDREDSRRSAARPGADAPRRRPGPHRRARRYRRSLLAHARRLLIDTEHEGVAALTASAIAIAVAGIAMAGISTAATAPVDRRTLAPASGSLDILGVIEVIGVKGIAGEIRRSARSRRIRHRGAGAQPARPPQPVITAPDPSAPFAARRAGPSVGRRRRSSSYWLGYSIRPVKGLHPIIYFDQESMVTTSDGVRISGHMFSLSRGWPQLSPDSRSRLRMRIHVGSRSFCSSKRGGGSPRLSRVHASTHATSVRGARPPDLLDWRR